MGRWAVEGLWRAAIKLVAFSTSLDLIRIVALWATHMGVFQWPP